MVLLRHTTARSWCSPPSTSMTSGFPASVHVGVLFYYGLELQNMHPKTIIHISCFITLCEAYLGMGPTGSGGSICLAHG